MVLVISERKPAGSLSIYKYHNYLSPTKNMNAVKTSLIFFSFVSVAVITAIVFGSPSSVKAQAPLITTTPTTQDVNFTQLFQEKLQDRFLAVDADVVYQSPSTVVLEGDKITIGESSGGLINNVFLWQGVDLVKQYGYEIDSVAISGLGTRDNPTSYHVIMSKP